MFNKLDKALKKIVVIFLVAMAVFSCNTEQGLDFKTIHFALEEAAKITVDYPAAISNSEAAERINQTVINKIINALSLDDQSTSSNVNDAINKFNEEFLNFKSNFPDDVIAWEAYIEGEVLYNSPLITTISINSYQFTGGAHGSDYVEMLNFNTETGELLKLEDVLNVNAGFMSLVKQKFEETVMKNEGNINDYFFGEGFKLPENIGLSEDGVVFLYNKYEIASYAQGYTEFLIDFKALEPFLKLR